MRKILGFILSLACAITYSQSTVLTIEGQTYLSTDPEWDGVQIPKDNPTLLRFKNNNITSLITGGYIIKCGTDQSTLYDNNMDNAIITGNKYVSTNTKLPSYSHGMMAGYSINQLIKYNYSEKAGYGIVFKAGDGTDTTGMMYTLGGCAYNIFKNNCLHGVIIKGIGGVKIYNNTFYNGAEGSDNWMSSLLAVGENQAVTPYTHAEYVAVKNNIFYSVENTPAIQIRPSSLATFECDYNIYWVEEGDHKPIFVILNPNGSSTITTWSEWRALGFDAHSVVVNPNFIDTDAFVPSSRLDYGTDLGPEWLYGLSSTAEWKVGEAPDTTTQNGKWQVGARVIGSVGLIPQYVTSIVRDPTPNRIEITFDQVLAEIVPSSSSFIVTVNSSIVKVNSVEITRNAVYLILENPLLNGDIITFAYIKPQENPLQTLSGARVELPETMNVINQVAPANLPPVVNLTTPSENMSYVSPAIITIQAQAFDPDGIISKVEFFQSTSKLGETAASPYNFRWEDVLPGTYSITAVATDNNGLSATSANVIVIVANPVTEHNEPPMVDLVLRDNKATYSLFEKIAIEAQTLDKDGYITQVEFVNDKSILMTLSTEPYIFIWEPSDTGKFTISAIAKDNKGATSNISSVELTINNKAIEDQLVSLYPVPNRGRLTVDISRLIPDRAIQLEIVSSLGELVFSKAILEDEFCTVIDTSILVNGFYLLIIRSMKGIITSKAFLKI